MGHYYGLDLYSHFKRAGISQSHATVLVLLILCLFYWEFPCDGVNAGPRKRLSDEVDCPQNKLKVIKVLVFIMDNKLRLFLATKNASS